MDNPPCTISVTIKYIQGRVVWTQLLRRQVGNVDVEIHATLGPKSCLALFRSRGIKEALIWREADLSLPRYRERAWVCVSSTSNLLSFGIYRMIKMLRESRTWSGTWGARKTQPFYEITQPLNNSRLWSFVASIKHVTTAILRWLHYRKKWFKVNSACFDVSL